MMSVKTLEQKAKRFAKEYWGLDFNLPIKTNGRLSRGLGQYIHITNGNFTKPIRIEISKDLLAKYNEETIDSVIKHELTHWALSIQGQPFKDGHPVFEKELKRVGAHPTGVIPYIGPLYQARCTKCQKIVSRKPNKKRLETTIRKYTHCGGYELEYAGYIYVGQDAPEVKAPSKQNPTREEVAAIQTASPSIEKIIEVGKRGVTNKQMIPAMREAIDAGSRIRLEILKQHYPEVFQNSIRYLGKKYNARFEQLMRK